MDLPRESGSDQLGFAFLFLVTVMQSQLWDGLAHRPVAIWQSGGISRLFDIGVLLRSKDEEIIRTRRALSQSVLYSSCSLPSDKPAYSPQQWAVLESLKEILHRSELCPLDPTVDLELLHLTGNPRWTCEEGEEYAFTGLSADASVQMLRAWIRSRVPAATGPPISVFDDEEPGGEGPERRFWNKLQGFRGGVLRAWLHPQVLFSSLSEDSVADDRRVDFALSPPWCRALCWEIHGEFSPEDEVKSRELLEAARRRDKRRESSPCAEGGWDCLDDVRDSSHPRPVSDEERIARLERLLPSGQPSPLTNDVSTLLDGAWVASQIDLALHFVLSMGLVDEEGEFVYIAVPEGMESLRDAAVSAFVSLLRAIEDVWGIGEGERLLPAGVNTAYLPEAAVLSVEINPAAHTYIAAADRLPEKALSIRRACFPFDAAPARLPWSVQGIDGLRPESDPSGDSLTVLLRRIFGKRSLRAGQAEGIVRSLTGEDALILLPTGHGKSLIFQMAALLLPGVTLVVEGWRATIDDQLRCLENYGISRILGIHYGLQLGSPKRLSEANLIYVAPERLYIDGFIEHLELLVKERGIDLLVVDEAHAVSEAGHSFRPSYLGITARMRLFCSRWGKEAPTVLALTATAADVVLRDVRGILGIESDPVTIVSGGQSEANPRYRFVRTNLCDEPTSYPAGERSGGMRRELAKALNSDRSTGKGIVFCSSRGRWTKSDLPWYGVEETADEIRGILEGGERVSTYVGGDLSADALKERDRMLREFLDGGARIMVSTNAFGTGIDVPDVDWTVHLGLPAGLEAYYQELGRAGRKGQRACGFPIFDEDSQEFLDELARSQSTPDSFGPLRKLLSSSNVVKGSLARQLSLMLGKDGSLPGPGFGVRTTFRYLPSFPGWRFEHEVYNTCAVDAVFGSPSEEIVIFFAEVSESFVWKAVHRLVELGIVHPDYRRTFSTRGENRFTLTTSDLKDNAAPDVLSERVGVVVGRMRGGAKGREAWQKTLRLLSGIGSDRDRVLAASRVLIANTYEVVRESRVSSLVYLHSYTTEGSAEESQEASQERRYELLEDYFGREEKFGKLIMKLSEAEATAESWTRALGSALRQDRWRKGVFQRASEAFPGAPLPSLLLLYGAVREQDGFGGALALRRLVQASGFSPQLLRWALERAGSSQPDGLAFLVKLLDDAVEDMSDGELERLGPWVLGSLSDDLGDSRTVRWVVANWLERALDRGARHV